MSGVMDQIRHDLETGGGLNQAYSGTREHSEHSVDETGVVIDLEDGPVASPQQVGQPETRSHDLGSSGVADEVADNAILVHQERNDGSLGQVGDQGTSRCSEEDGVDRGSEAKGGGESKSETVLKEDLKKSVFAKGDDSYLIDIQCSSVHGGCGENGEVERVCRICHLSSEQSVDAIPGMTMGDGMTAAMSSMELIQLGCGCKDELGIAHSHCAEAWFKLKGNRFCEICGESAKNISGVGDNSFMEEWNERRFTAGDINSPESGGCWRGQPFCNFLMACLVIAFVLPWFFRVNMF